MGRLLGEARLGSGKEALRGGPGGAPPTEPLTIKHLLIFNIHPTFLSFILSLFFYCITHLSYLSIFSLLFLSFSGGRFTFLSLYIFLLRLNGCAEIFLYIYRHVLWGPLLCKFLQGLKPNNRLYIRTTIGGSWVGSHV